MGKKSKPPSPPDPQATIQAQTQGNLDTARTQTELNRYNVNTPFGGVNWTRNGDQWTQNVSESPNQAALRGLEEQQGLALGNLGLTQTNRVADLLSQPYDPRRVDIAGSLGNYGSDVEARTQALLDRGVGEYARRGQESLDSRLAAQGINLGSEAYGNAQRDFAAGIGDAYANNALTARAQGQNDRGQAMSELLSQYGYDTTADQAARSNPLNEIIALANGVQTNPINPGQGAQTSINPTDIAGIIGQGYQNQLGRYNAVQGQRNALLGSLAQLGSAAITMSDRRLKRDVEFVGTDANGVNWYDYRYTWDDPEAPKRRGVMADEVPHARIMTTSGFWAVDYGRL